MDDQGQNVTDDPNVDPAVDEDQKEGEKGMPMAEVPTEGEGIPEVPEEKTAEETPEEGSEDTTVTE